ncbi:hypothetical protein CROQUDRAFT_651650 [Cronartium quercuum f. sp. fusiforme G11]|uniref:GST N-terminal domain-containing protein n=1 Tax=Cronartium quercuum f. sp. fusiforme G11 TaxID=708437 RepID=A0A9P6NX89_9BASI|nr:hypothetical protein CROQUDRAFT_651650 [Cronartium quercuum f. sp. fusiforme G11]
MTSQDNSTPKATLYVFQGSLWASVPQLGLIEKGYTTDQYNLRTVNLFKGENFCPEFLRLNPRGTVPVLVVPVINPEPDHPQKYKSLTDSAQILEFLDVSRKPHSSHHSSNLNPAPTLSPAIISAKMESDKLINLVHDELHDLNFLKRGCLNWEDVEKKGSEYSVIKQFINNRIEALEKYSEENSTATNAIKSVWEDRLKSDKQIMEIYSKSATPEVANEFFKRTLKVWEKVVMMLGKIFRTIASHNGDYILGEQISLVDLHIGAWLARLFTILGYAEAPSSSTNPTSGLNLHQRLQSVLSIGELVFDQEELKKVCVGIEKYWSVLSARDSFRQVYADGLH